MSSPAGSVPNGEGHVSNRVFSTSSSDSSVCWTVRGSLGMSAARYLVALGLSHVVE